MVWATSVTDGPSVRVTSIFATRGRAASPDSLSHVSAAKTWIPNQHGAWAMLAVPFAAGAILRARAADLPAWLTPLAVLWLFGYLAWDTFLRWRKMAPRRRKAVQTPLITYAAICTLAGIVILVAGGIVLAPWTVAFAPLVAAALYLAAHKQERSAISGLITVGAACMMFFVVRCGGWPLLWPGNDLFAGLVLYGYFGGTVFHVKSLIRGRADASSARPGYIWHGVWLVAVAASAVAGLASWWWTPFFVALVARTWWMKRLENRGQVLRPAVIGVTEIVLSIIALLITVS